MCGIAGIVGAGPGAQVDSTLVRKMCQAIVHRGPDDEGVYAWGPVGLGMRRLSIIDLAGGQQPIHNEDRSIWIVFNGEIYNFLDLRAELESDGHTFYTHSDTETIVHLYEKYGSDCVRRLRGMFAFAIYDFNRSTLLLARDRIGKKPLHYSLHNGFLYFGSEIKSLLSVTPELSELDHEALLQYFSLRYILDPRTAFKSICKLPPGHLMEFSRGSLNIRKYWELPAFGTRTPISEEDCLEELEHHLAEAVRIRLISEVPLGALLSGGVDSSLVVALMARASSRPVKTFSIGFGEAAFNESEHAATVARHFATDHHELIVQPQLEATLDQLTHHLDEPFGDSSMLPTFQVCRLAREHVTVALSGDGGDELFAGYDRYPGFVRRRSLPAWLGTWYRRKVYPWLPAKTVGRRLLYNLSLPQAERYLDSMSVLCAWGRDAELFTPDFLQRGDCGIRSAREFCRVFDTVPVSDTISRLQYLDSLTYLPGDVLAKVDRMSMASSLEMRSPLLDHVVIELAASLPARWKLRNGESKYILKKLAERVGVPREVLYRRKQGFAVPLVHWFRTELRHKITEILLDSQTLQRGYYRAQGVRGLLHEHFSGRRDRSEELWLLLVFELWNRNFLAQIGRNQPEAMLCASPAHTKGDGIG